MYRQLFNNKGIAILIILALLFLYFLYNRDGSTIGEQTKLKLLDNESDLKEESTSALLLSERFSVFDEVCKIPYVDPFAYKDVVRAFKFKVCTTETDLFYVEYNRKEREYIVRVNISIYQTNSRIACVAYPIVQESKKRPAWNNTSISFLWKWIVPRHVHGVVVECHDMDKSQLLQRDAFSFVPYPDNRNENNDSERCRTHPSIIMLGIGSMSQMNFQRTMPLTAQFVSQEGWYEMLGYTKSHSKQLVSLLTVLSGHTPEQWKKFCDIKNPGCLDAITYVWEHFHNSGYLTAYAEDTPALNFARQPVDYYLHPIMEAIDGILGKVKRKKFDYCLGRKYSYQYVFDYCEQLVQRFVLEVPKPLFGFFWTNSFSRDDFRGAQSVDKDIKNYLERYKKLGLFENAIVILFSDQGQNRGQLMGLPSSFLEERLPMLHIYLPPWYRSQNPKIAEALSINRRRLTSGVDLHMTLKAVLMRLHPSLAFETLCTNCVPLFVQVPMNRSCQRASIKDNNCACQPYIQVPLTPSLNNFAKIVVNQMNKYLYENNFNRKCHHLQLNILLKVERQQYFDEIGNEVSPPNDFTQYRLKFLTSPLAIFDARISSNNDVSAVDIPIRLITRGGPNHMKCLNNTVAQNICICRRTQ